MAKQHRSDINVNVILDKNKIPEKLQWSAKDGGIENMDSKAIFMSVWDHKAKEALRIDLWTKDMPINDMFSMYHQTMMGMASSLEKATGHEKLAGALRDYCEFFAEETKIMR